MELIAYLKLEATLRLLPLLALLLFLIWLFLRLLLLLGLSLLWPTLPQLLSSS